MKGEGGVGGEQPGRERGQDQHAPGAWRVSGHVRTPGDTRAGSAELRQCAFTVVMVDAVLTSRTYEL